MKRTSTLLLVLLACSLAFGAPVSKQSAQKIAEAFMNRNAASGTNRAKGRGAADQESKHAASESMDINGSLYLFNASDGNGFVIVSGDDRTAPVLGYSDTGRIDFDNMPQNMRSWLQHYVEQIEYVQNNTLSTTSGTIENVGTPIPQQLDCKWDQDAPYFDKCPISTSYYDDACTNQCVLYDKKGNPVANPGRSLTGCAATAMAQVLYAWKGEGMAATAAEIPGQPSAKRQIYSSYAKTYVYSKFSYDAIPAGTPIDWDNILPEYSMYDASLKYHVLEGPTAKQKEAVATLMHICGAALDMKYNFEASSVSLEAGINAAAKYLGFPNASACYQKCYKYNEWLKLLYDELSVARAVYFTGVKENNSGHAFVIDLFHIGLHHEVDAALGECLAQSFGDVAVEHGQAFLQVFQHCHLAAEAVEDGGELHPHHAGADDDQSLRDVVYVEQLSGSHNLWMVVARDGKSLGSGTGGDDDGGGSVFLVAHGHHLGCGETCLAPHQ